MFEIQDLDILCMCQGKESLFLKDFTLEDLQEKQEKIIAAIKILLAAVEKYLPLVANLNAKNALTKDKEKIAKCLEINQNLDIKSIYMNGRENYTKELASFHQFSLLFPFLNTSCIVGKCSSMTDRYPKYKEADIMVVEQFLYAYDNCFARIGIYGLNASDARRSFLYQDGKELDSLLDANGVVDTYPEEEFPEKFLITSMPYYITYPNYHYNGSVDYLRWSVNPLRVSYSEEYLTELTNNSSLGSR